MLLCLYSEPREYEINKTCIECDPECQLMNETQTCTGPVSLTAYITKISQAFSASIMLC